MTGGSGKNAEIVHGPVVLVTGGYGTDFMEEEALPRVLWPAHHRRHPMATIAPATDMKSPFPIFHRLASAPFAYSPCCPARETFKMHPTGLVKLNKPDARWSSSSPPTRLSMPRVVLVDVNIR
ncbi:hypothetical protein FIBSPDRAFT_56781 [Athelia psychrophila]|uniref:Uncharacterized protein n=1 Tax=Athelia psychrophila TaxID=1759441 RepID=A0A166FBL0_9AGAM|nr:hypothetical protein FIBSPDRAFT_56781 [Fibularhizoctonia sp. CBS 109695]